MLAKVKRQNKIFMLLLYCLLYAMYLHSIYQVDSIILPLSLQDIEEFSFGGYSSVQCVETWPPWMGNTFTLVVLCIQYLLPLVVLPLVHSQVPPRPRPRLGMLIAFDCILYRF